MKIDLLRVGRPTLRVSSEHLDSELTKAEPTLLTLAGGGRTRTSGAVGR